MRPCFKISATASVDQPATVSIYDEIGFWGTQAKDFIAQIGAIKSDTINVEINSPGGDYFAGVAMYNALKASGKTVVAKAMGIVASAATLPFLAADKRIMPENTYLMVHQPLTGVVGNADEMRTMADTLDKFTAGMRATYASATGLSDEKLTELLAQDTWLSAAEAKDLGFATDVADAVAAQASFDMKRADLPAHIKAVFDAAKAEPAEPAAPATEVTLPAEPDLFADPALAEQVEALAAKAGIAEHAKVIALVAASIEDARTRISAAREIAALCRVAGKPELAAEAVRNNLPVADVRTKLIDARAEADQHIDTTRQDSTGAKTGSSGVSTDTIWNSHRKQRKAA